MADPTSEGVQAAQTVVNSSIVVPASTDSSPQRKRQSDEQVDQTDKKEVGKRPRLDMSQDGQRRGKRMFGVLMGTLNKFKTETSNKSTAEKQREEIDNKLKEKLERERSELADKVKKDKEEHFKRIKEQKRQSERAITHKMELANAKHRVHLSNFIKTMAEPQLLYRPAKLSDEQMEQVKGQTEKAKVDLEDVIRKHEEENAAHTKIIEDEDMKESVDNSEATHEDEQTKEDAKMDIAEVTQPEAPAPVEEADANSTSATQDHTTTNDAEQREDTSSQNGDVVDYE
ncbi:pinin/SDK/memA/ protein conserved region-domain-containing protein [Umbelopsis sp. PMI_123]|nr:pinin/SDK/memA/ protein conserved region-domain-containing protein [Umbelopsis sp. PMI_123]